MTTTLQTAQQADGNQPQPKPRGTPPEWAAERAVKWVGRAPAAAGRALDRAAKWPGIGWIVRRLSSVWLGIITLLLIGLYVGLGSGLPNLRAAFEMTDLQFFDAWPMRVLLAVLALDLTIVTLRKIPFTLFKLGSWTVHIGILTLITGSVWYFSMKQEGSARLYLNQPSTHWYDVTERALYAYPMRADGTFDVDHPTITPMAQLPIYDEHIEEGDHHNPLDLHLTGAVAGLDVRVGGYYPCAVLEVARYHEAAAGETFAGPAVGVTFSTRRDQIPEKWLESDTPAQRLLELQLPFAVEFLKNPTPERVRELQTSFAGPLALTVRIPKLGIEKTYPAEQDKAIVVEGSPYTLVPRSYSEMQMASKGYEGLKSTNMMVAVSRKDGDKTFEFSRMCVSRYPERSPDFVSANGTQKRVQDGVDHDIEIIFQDASQTQAWIVEGADGKLTAIVRTPDGKSVAQAVTDQPVPLPLEQFPDLKMTVTGHTEKSVAEYVPHIVPPEQRPRGQTVMELLQLSAIDMDILLPGGQKVPHVYVPFVAYGEVAGPEGVKPAVVNIPGKGMYGFVMSTTRRDLPTPVTLVKFDPVKFPGAVHSYMDYASSLKFADSGDVKTTHLNRPVYDKGLIYFQSQWDGDPNAPPEKRFSVMGVANRPGLHVMILGAILIAMGIGYAFYAKPLLLKAKKASLAAWAGTKHDDAKNARSARRASAQARMTNDESNSKLEF